MSSPARRYKASVCSIDRIESARCPYPCRTYLGGNRARDHVIRVKLAGFEKSKKEEMREKSHGEGVGVGKVARQGRTREHKSGTQAA